MCCFFYLVVYLSLLGIHGIAEAYIQAVPRIQLWGPTNIAPIINHVARFAAHAQSQESSPRVSENMAETFFESFVFF